jgi:molybdate transport system ATP-binding protein
MTVKARFSLTRGGFALDANLEVPGTGVTALFGPSGCGKTTLLRVMAGLEKCPGGYMKVDDQVWQDEEVFLPVHRRALGFVFQEPSLFSHLSVRGNLEYGYKRTAPDRRGADPVQAASLLGVRELLDRSPAGLSGGEKQRVALARALVTGPRLLLMDEPLASLDTAGKDAILPYLKKVPAELGVPAVFVSHDLGEVASLADHLALMNDGQVVAQGPLNELLTRTDLPLSAEPEASSVLSVCVRSHDENFGLSELEHPGGIFWVPRLALQPGEEARLRILARDVSLTLQRQEGTSILNILPARVAGLRDEDQAKVTVVLDLGPDRILARVTRRSAQALELREGRELFVQVKSLAVLT